jgi:sulfatase modifying factor 1
MFRKLNLIFKTSFKKYRLILGIVVGFVLVFLGHFGLKVTSADRFCDLCHAHPHVTESWKLSTHYKNQSGVVVHCVECHLPPGGVDYVAEKARLGLKDAYGSVFKDVSQIDWEAKSRLKHATTYTYDASCVRCHAELFSLDLSQKGTDAHVYYFHRMEEMRCINCHLHVGHYSEEASEEVRLAESVTERRESMLPPRPASPDAFLDYAERITGTDVVFEMIAIPGGTFTMGSPNTEPKRRKDEGPTYEVRVSPFWMGRTEVSWKEWEVYYRRMGTKGKYGSAEYGEEVDAVTGPTPPYGSPDQGWGRGSRPAITMTHHAAMEYCEWLSSITGEMYRLPTEAEWEYACRGGTSDPYFFEGNPSKLTGRSWKNRIFGADTAGIQRFAWYGMNAGGKTYPAYSRTENPFGLIHMLGNVREFCLDYYSPEAYKIYTDDSLVIDPVGPTSGTEHVIRGGSFLSDAADVRSASRDHTRTDAWLLTDPQSPKSIWWYSDCYDVGFRVVREYRR